MPIIKIRRKVRPTAYYYSRRGAGESTTGCCCNCCDDDDDDPQPPPCDACTETQPTSFSVVISPITNNICSTCTSLEGNYADFVQLSDCVWIQCTGVICNDNEVCAKIERVQTAPGQGYYRLTLGLGPNPPGSAVIARWEEDTPGPDCLGLFAMEKVAGQPLCNTPQTITLAAS